MEKMQDDLIELLNKEYIENRFINFITEYLLNIGIDNIINCNENSFNASIEKFGNEIIKSGLIYIDQNRKILNICFLDMLCDVYMFVCKLYNKTSSIYTYSHIIGINNKILDKWKIDINYNTLNDNIYITELFTLYNNINNTNDYTMYINKVLDLYNNRGEIITLLKALIISKLHTDREQTIKSKLSSYNQPVGLLSVVNKDYQWTAQQIQVETQARALSLQELPKLESIFNNKQ